jgi:hypothetical protein
MVIKHSVASPTREMTLIIDEKSQVTTSQVHVLLSKDNSFVGMSCSKLQMKRCLEVHDKRPFHIKIN